jgi:hypothetical protein
MTYVDPDTNESKVLYEWSPGGASACHWRATRRYAIAVYDTR